MAGAGLERKRPERVQRYAEFRTVNDWVLMKPDEVRESEGGILLPESVEPEYSSVRGRCVSVGDGVLCEKPMRLTLLLGLDRLRQYTASMLFIVMFNWSSLEAAVVNPTYRFTPGNLLVTYTRGLTRTIYIAEYSLDGGLVQEITTPFSFAKHRQGTGSRIGPSRRICGSPRRTALASVRYAHAIQAKSRPL